MSTPQSFITVTFNFYNQTGEASDGKQRDTHTRSPSMLSLFFNVPTFNDHEQAICLSRLAEFGTIKSAFKYASSDSNLVICDLEIAVPDTRPRAEDILEVEITREARVHCRVYQSLLVPVIPKVAELHRQVSHIVVANSMTPAPGQESDFNRWYDEEHLALLSRSPLWLSSKRYILLSATDHAPQYLALHAWDGQEAFESEEYKHATDTEWKHKVVGRVLQREREVYSYVEQVSAVVSEIQSGHV